MGVEMPATRDQSDMVIAWPYWPFMVRRWYSLC